MSFQKGKLAAVITLALGGVFLTGCTSTSNETAQAETAPSAEAAKVDLTADAVMAKITKAHSSFAVAEHGGLAIKLDDVSQSQASSKWPNVKIHSETGQWNWSSKQGLKVTLENPMDEDVYIEMKVADTIGIMGAPSNQVDLPINLAANETTIVEFFFKGTEMKIDGYRGGAKLNTASIAEVQFYTVGPIEKQEFVVKDIDFLEAEGGDGQ